MKITTRKIQAGYKQVFYCLLVLAISTVAGCKKDDQSGQPDGTNNGGTIKYVLNDNFIFGNLYKTLTAAGYQDTLAKPGPYTFLAPDNNAFVSVSGYNFFLDTDHKRMMLNMMRYYTLAGRVSFKSLPLVQNKLILTGTGGNIYVSKYLKGTDTVTTINGVKVTTIDNPASNGLIQVLPQVLNPELYQKTTDYIHSDTTLSLFAAAMQRAKLDASLLAGNNDYTILAPSNTAFQRSGKLGKNLGVSTLDSILVADPEKLVAFLKYHITEGRYFEGDLYKYVIANPAGIAMLNGKKVVIGGSETTYHSMTFLGSGNNGVARLIPFNSTIPFTNYADITCGNGVIHVINQVLIP